MVHAYEWDEYYLLVTVRNRHGSYGYLLNHVSQEEFFEYYQEHWPEPRDQRITDMTVVPLTEASHELMEPVYSDEYKVGN